jgi:hypothetical protein
MSLLQNVFGPCQTPPAKRHPDSDWLTTQLHGPGIQQAPFVPVAVLPSASTIGNPEDGPNPAAPSVTPWISSADCRRELTRDWDGSVAGTDATCRRTALPFDDAAGSADFRVSAQPTVTAKSAVAARKPNEANERTTADFLRA